MYISCQPSCICTELPVLSSSMPLFHCMVQHNSTQLNSLFFVFGYHVNRGSKQAEWKLEGDVETLQTTDWLERIVISMTLHILLTIIFKKLSYCQ